MNPREHGELRTVDEAPLVRRLDCMNANACLAVADAQKWPSFTCNNCDGYEAPDAEQRARDVAGLLLVGRLLEQRGLRL